MHVCMDKAKEFEESKSYKKKIPPTTVEQAHKHMWNL